MSESRSWGREDGLIPLDRLAPWMSAVALAAVAALMALGLLSCGAGATKASSSNAADAALYSRVVEGVAHGGGYYQIAPLELRRGGFPLRPFMAVRPPLLTLLLARLPDRPARAVALAALAGGCLSAWAWRLRAMTRAQPFRYAAALILLASGLAPVLSPSAYLFHEVWAGLLISTSLALYSPRRWGVALALGLAAALLRELAAPYLLVMAAFALIEGRRIEAFAWAVALGGFAAALAAHAVVVSTVTTAADAVSPGWLGLGGWAFVLRTSNWDAVMLEAPLWLAAVLLPLAALGLATWAGPLGRRTGAMALGCMAGFCIVGRADNAYWGLLIAPVWPLGLAFADLAVRRLVMRALAPAAAAGAELAHAG